MPVSISAASAMPERSEPTLMLFAPSKATAPINISQGGPLRRSASPRPIPVTMPMRAHINCTQAMSGHVISAVHRSEVPSCAPAMEYVAIPDGSSSAAPVMTPGPSFAKKRFSQFDSERFFDIKLLFQREPALVELNICGADRRLLLERAVADLKLAEWKKPRFRSNICTSVCRKPPSIAASVGSHG